MILRRIAAILASFLQKKGQKKGANLFRCKGSPIVLTGMFYVPVML